MTESFWRVGVILLFSILAISLPLLGPLIAIGIYAIALIGVLSLSRRPWADAHYGTTGGINAWTSEHSTFVATVIGLGAASELLGLPYSVFVGTVFLVGFGLSLARLTSNWNVGTWTLLAVLCFGGGAIGLIGQILSRFITGDPIATALPLMLFIAANGVLLAAFIWVIIDRHVEAVVVLNVGLISWLFFELDLVLDVLTISVAIVLIAVIGYLSYILQTASVAGMLAGVMLGLLTIVLGGLEWFIILLTFFALGSFSTKYRYDVKHARGMAEPNSGARGGANVLGNAAIALFAVLGYAASSAEILSVRPELFLFAFAGSIATALSDTLSSEIGGVYDDPRLITTLESVTPGTNGGVTWQGEVAGFVGAAIVGVLSYVLFQDVTVIIGVAILVAGFIGMTMDSVLGATVEGLYLGNQGVNFVATLVGAILGAGIPYLLVL